ncbi:hypothetical protein SDC9_179322 [bioreactor metagenome]|uniref:Peptidoglycan binding-like domain-containing protein n=1 Tax=bioreactor metagenome TaxID=1076179 RepID=A0A645GYL9_9ZZZZ
MAADIYVKGMTPATLAKYSELAGFREIICYQVSESFCHVGTRSDKWYAITTDSGKTYRTVQTFGGSYPTLKAGVKNVSNVKKLQTLLKQKKYLGADKKALTIDGIFGANTTFAVKRFQKDNKIAVDGIVGIMTWKKLGI